MDDDKAGATAMTDVTIAIDNDAATAAIEMMKGIISGDRCDDDKHNNQPFDHNDAVATTRMTMKTAMTVMMMTTSMMMATVAATTKTTIAR